MSNANRQTPPGAEQEPTPAPDNKPETTAPRPSRSTSCDVICTRSFKIGGKQVPVGAKLAEVELAPGVDLNILVDAVRSGLAGEPPSAL